MLPAWRKRSRTIMATATAAATKRAVVTGTCRDNSAKTMKGEKLQMMLMNSPEKQMVQRSAGSQLPWNPEGTRCESCTLAIGPSANACASNTARSLRHSAAR